MKTFFTFLFFCFALSIVAQNYSQTDSSYTRKTILPWRISDARLYFFTGGGINQEKVEQLNPYGQPSVGKRLQDVMPDIFEMGFFYGKPKSSNNDWRGWGMDIDASIGKYSWEMSEYFKLFSCKRVNSFICVNSGLENFNIYTPKLATISNVRFNLYRSSYFYMGPSLHFNFFFHKDPQDSQRMGVGYIGVETGINFHLLHTNWKSKYGYYEYGRSILFYTSAKNVNVPLPGNICVFVRITIGTALQ